MTYDGVEIQSVAEYNKILSDSSQKLQQWHYPEDLYGYIQEEIINDLILCDTVQYKRNVYF